MISNIRSYITPNFFAMLALLIVAYAQLLGRSTPYLALVFVIAAFWGGYWSKRNNSIALRYMSISFLVYYFWFGLSGLLQPFDLSFHSNPFLDYFSGLNSPFLILAFVILLAPKLLKEMSLERLAFHSRMGLLFSGVIMILPSLFDIVQNRSPFLTYNTLMVSFMVAVSSFVSFLDWRSSNFLQKNLAFLAFFIGFIIQIYVTEARAMFLVMIMMLPLLFLFLIQVSDWSKKTKLIWVVASIGAMVLALVAINMGHIGVVNRIQAAINALQNFDNMKRIDWSLASRLDMWQASIAAIKVAPFTGYGPQGAFEPIMPYMRMEFTFPHVHNQILHDWLVGGVLGVVFYFNIILLPFITLFILKHGRIEFIFLAFVLTGILFINGLTYMNFFNDLRSTFWCFYLMVFTALAYNDKRRLDGLSV